MQLTVLGYRDLSDLELRCGESFPISRRGVLRGLVTTSIIGTTCSISGQATAQARALAYLGFVSNVLDIADRIIRIYKAATAHTEVQNQTDEMQRGNLFGYINDGRGLLEQQTYQVVIVPPRQAAVIRISLNVGGNPGMKEMGVRSAIDFTSGTLRVIA
jgi:hypothetical protein